MPDKWKKIFLKMATSQCFGYVGLTAIDRGGHCHPTMVAEKFFWKKADRLLRPIWDKSPLCAPIPAVVALWVIIPPGFSESQSKSGLRSNFSTLTKVQISTIIPFLNRGLFGIAHILCCSAHSSSAIFISLCPNVGAACSEHTCIRFRVYLDTRGGLWLCC